MGMDGIELVLEVENVFNITISDQEAAQIITVGDLYNCVLSKVKAAEEGNKDKICMTARAFYQLRRGLADYFRLDTKQIHPNTLTAPIFAPDHRNRSWKNLAKQLNLRFPRLKTPAWLLGLEVLMFVLFSAGLFRAMYQTNAFFPLILILCFLILYLKWISPQKARWFVLEIPPNCQTMGHFAKSLLPLNYSRIAQQESGYKEEIWHTLCDIISDQLGVAKSKLTPQTDFVKDLNVD